MATQPVALIALTSFFVAVKDSPAPRLVKRGDVVLSTDPVVKGREVLFAPAIPEETSSSPEAPAVETAEAAPGAKRPYTRRAPKGGK